MPTANTILVVTAHPQLRQSLRDWLALHLPWCAIVAAAGVAEALTLGKEQLVQAFIVDLDGGRENGLAVVERLREAAPETPLIALGLDRSPAPRAAALTAGATAYVPKDALSSELLLLLKPLFARPMVENGACH